MNDGTHRMTILMHDRRVTGLHLCANCVTILSEAFRQREDAMLAIGETCWRGPCDLCRYTTTLSDMLEGGWA